MHWTYSYRLGGHSHLDPILTLTLAVALGPASADQVEEGCHGVRVSVRYENLLVDGKGSTYT